MLTLADSFHIDGHTVFRDIVRKDERWNLTSRVYALPDRPRLARDTDGRVLFDALRYRGRPGDQSPRGAVVSLAVELGVQLELRETLKVAVRAALRLGPEIAVELLPLPLVGGMVALAFAGESGEADFVRALGGNGPARIAGHERASFLIDVTEQAASLLWTALDSNVDVLHARYDLDVQHALGDIVLRVWCDARRAHSALAARLTTGTMTPADMRSTLHDEQLAGYTIEIDRVIADDERRRLDEIGSALLEQVLTESLFVFQGANDRNGLATRRGTAQLRAFSDGLSAQVNRRITQSYPAIGHLVVEDVLSLAPFRAEIGDQIREITIETAASRALDLLLNCTVNFADDLIEQVKATVRPLDAAPGAAPGEFIFRDGVITARYRVDLPPGASHRYRIDAVVYFRGDPRPFPVSYPESEAALTVLDLDGVGSLTVQVSLGDVPLERVRQVKIELVHPATGAAGQMLLDAGRSSDRWRIVTRDQPRTYRRRLVWLLADDSRIEEEWAEATAERWVIHAPTHLRDQGEVVLISGGSFSNVSQIVTELRPGPNAAAARFAFTAPDQSHKWRRPESSDAGGRYEVREITIDRAGGVSETPWRTDDSPVIVVRDRTSFTVRILPRLLPLGPEHPIALVALEPIEEADPVHRTTLTLRNQQETSWTFPIGERDHHRYRHQVTLVSRTGVRRSGAWLEGESALLVLLPPA